MIYRKRDATGRPIRGSASYTAITTFAPGGNRIVRAGTTLRGNDPLVQGSPLRFVPLGTSEQEIRTIKIARQFPELKELHR